MRPSLLLVSVTTLLAACSGVDGVPKSNPDAGGTLVLAIPEPQELFPPLANESAGRLVTDQVFDRLAEIKPELATIGDKGFAPRLAKSWKWAPDSLSIAFSIDPRARWHDGKPVHASDVRYTFRVTVDPAVGSPNAALVTNIDSVSVRDSLTAVVWFKKRTPEQFYDAAYQLVIVPEHVYGAIPPKELHTSPITRSPIGSGRFRFVKWEPGVRLELVSDTANYRGRAVLDRIVLTPTTETNVAAAKVMSGDADFMEAFPIDQLAQLDTSTTAGPLPYPSFGYVYMTMNRYDPKSPHSPHPIFGDLRVRRAFVMAADRNAMLQNVFGKSGRLSHGPFPMTASYADSTLRLPRFDTTAAKALLDSAGWRARADGKRANNGRPLRFKLIVPSTSLARRNYAVLLQEQFRRVGAQMDISVVEQGPYGAHLEKGTYDAIMDGYNTDPGPSGMQQRWGTAGIAYVEGKGVSGANTMRYSNPAVDASLDSATMTFDFARARAYTSRASQMIIDDAPALFLYDMYLTHALSRRVTPTALRTDAWWAGLADWKIPADKRIARDRIGLAQATP
jgi:peptide/nickel transport system substrate-binding protein